jgi:hypothetical protein
LNACIVGPVFLLKEAAKFIRMCWNFALPQGGDIEVATGIPFIVQ